MIYLWWPFPTMMGFDVLNALAPGFAITATMPAGNLDQTYGVIYRIDNTQAPPVAQYMAAGTAINLGNNDAVYIVGHCAAGVTSLIGEYASYPVIEGYGEQVGTQFRHTRFKIAPQMNISDYLDLLRKFCKPFLPAGPDNFKFQIDYRENVVKVYTVNDVTLTHTTIAGTQLTVTNAERQFVMRQHVDKYSGEAKSVREFEKTANALAYALRGRFRPVGGCTAQIVLWACYSAKSKLGDKSLAVALKECLASAKLGLPALRVYGCSGKASDQARTTRNGPVVTRELRVQDQSGTWQPVAFGINMQEVRLLQRA